MTTLALSSIYTRSIIPLRQSHVTISSSVFHPLIFNKETKKRTAMISSVAEEKQTLFPEEVNAAAAAAEHAVSVPVSTADLLTMFFQAEGTMNEAVIPTVTSALQETEGISNLNVRIVEGIASVELMKKTTVQATGVASNLVEIIHSSGFKLQTLNLSFEDEEEVLVA